MQNFDFSIVLPAYNDLELFRRTLESVRCQRDVTMEIIVVDDSNQNDDIEQYVASLHDERINYNHNRPSLGAVRNWNSGLKLCHGDNVMVVHHDEAMQNDCFLKNVKQQLQNSDVVVSNIEIHHINGKVYGLYSAWFKKMEIRFPAMLFAVNAFGPCAVVAFRRSVQKQFDERTNWFVDVEWYYRLIKGSHVVYLQSATIVSQHGHKGQITNMIDTTATAKEDKVWLDQKYASVMSVRWAMWFQIYVLHNDKLHAVLKKIFGR